MRICVISFHICPYSRLGGEDSGGMNVYLKEWSSVLLSSPDVEIDIFTRIQNSEMEGIRTISPRFRIIHLKGGIKKPVEKRKSYDFLPEFIKNLESFIHQEKKYYDIVYSHYWLSGLAGEWIKYKFNIPLVHTYHTLAFLKKQVIKENEHASRVRAEYHLAKVSDVIISSSLEEKSSLIGEYEIPSSKVKVVHPGVNAEFFYPFVNENVCREIGSHTGEIYLLFVGRIQPVKGLITLIEAFSFLKHKNQALYDRLKLVIIGGGSRKHDLPNNQEFIRIQKVINNRKLVDKILFLGSRKQDELKMYYTATDALVMPSLYESFGLVVVEALSCGTPVLASQIGMMRTTIQEGKNGFSFRPNDTTSLAACLETFHLRKDRLWSNDKIRRDIVKKFSWKKTAEETIQVFYSLQRTRTYPTTIFQSDESPQLA